MSGEGAAIQQVPIEHLAEEFLARYRRGEFPPITSYVAAHPELAEEIRELFPTLMMLERVSPQPDEIASGVTPDKIGCAVPKQLGEYRILREIGRGGMGIVYEAEQLSLGRHVALKVLPAHALLTPNLLTRFQNEARAAARLHHTNIVPVFGVGEDQGVHYYAMQFIQGHGLDEVLEELRRLRRHEGTGAQRSADPPDEEPPGRPLSRMIAKSLAAGELASEPRRPGEPGKELDSPGADAAPVPPDRQTHSDGSEPVHRSESCGLLYRPLDGSSSAHSRSHSIYVRSVARMGLQVADALAHAHSQGVLHRDIKPSNLLLDAHGMVWITDFGLAKQEGSDLTHSGDVVGTLRYLAPERFRGTSDARTDIYGLGVTLYELLTTRPAFATTDRHHLIHDIAHLEPLPLRRLEPHVPRDLETIVLKAMAKEPVGRYATADEMAADLRRFLEDQPIAARRTWVVERVWRWCARRPALTAMSVALLVSLAIGFCGVLWQWGRAERQKTLLAASLRATRSEEQRAQRNLEEASRQRTIAEHEAARAEANYGTARQAVGDLLTTVSEDDLKNQPGLQAVRLRLLTRALEYYQGMLAQRANDPKAQLDLAEGYVRVADIIRLTGTTAEAKAAYQNAVKLLEGAVANRQGDQKTTLQLVGACNDLCLLHMKDREYPEAERLLQRASELITPLADSAPEDATLQRYLTRTLTNVAWWTSQAPAPDPRAQAEKAIEIHQQALVIQRRMANQQPGDYLLWRDLSITLSNMGRRNISVGRIDEARRLFEECLQIRLDLVQRNPVSLDAKYFVSAAYDALGDVVVRSPRFSHGDFELGQGYYAKALEIVEPLVRENPAVAAFREMLKDVLQSFGNLHSRHGDLAESLGFYQRAVALLESDVSGNPTNNVHHKDLAIALATEADLEQKLQRYNDSLAHRFQAREAWHQVQRLESSVVPRFRNQMIDNLARLMQELGISRRMSEVYDVAVEWRELCEGQPRRMFVLATSLERAVRSGRRGAGPIAFGEDFQRCLDLAIEAFSAGAQAAPDQVQGFVRGTPAMGDYAALATVETALLKDPQNASLLAQRSEHLRHLRHPRRADEDLNRALEILNAALERSPNDIALLRERARLHFDAGHWQQTAEDSSKIVAATRSPTTSLAYHAISMISLGNWKEANNDYAVLWRNRFRWPKRVLEWCRAAYELGLTEDIETHSAQLFELVGDDDAKADAAAWQILANGDVGRFPDLAVKLAQRAIELKPLPAYQATLGGIYYRQARYEEAVTALRPAAEQKPGEASALAGLFLAMSYHHLDEPEKARATFRRAERSWKEAIDILRAKEAYLESLWQEAKSLVDG
jgi:serine/threonine protein kinase